MSEIPCSLLYRFVPAENGADFEHAVRAPCLESFSLPH